MSRTFPAAPALAALLLAMAGPALAGCPPMTLYLHSAPTGVGNVDLLGTEWGPLGATETGSPDGIAGGTMDHVHPDKSVPSVWHASPLLDAPAAGSVWDTTWRYLQPQDYEFVNASIHVEFWVSTADASSLLGHAWAVKLHNNNAPLASVVATAPPMLPGFPAKVEATFSGLTFKGYVIDLQLGPALPGQDAANAVIFDSVEFPAHMEIINMDGV